MVYQTALLFELSLPTAFYGFVFFGTLCSYNFHWLFTPHRLPSAASVKLRWHIQFKKLHWALTLVSFIIAVYCTVLLLPYWPWLLASAVLTFLYSAPKIPIPPFTHLRKIAYGKTVFLAYAWMHITTQLPLLITSSDWTLPQYVFALYRFALIYTICILFDLRDRDKDRAEGIKSMVTQMSKPQVSIIYFGILMLLAATTFWLAFFLPYGTSLALLIPGLFLLLFYQWLSRQTSDYLFYFGLDGLMVFSLPLMLLFPF